MQIKSLAWTGALLGFALGGFFDGILLHQILQWHHLLSNVDAIRDIRGQMLADGLFHALMYLLAVVAIYKLWRQRSYLVETGAGTTLWAWALIGFGSWHVVDSVFSHWVTGIHRIRIDSPNPLLWDLIWFAAFGLVPLLLGWMWLRHRGGGGPGHGRATAACLAATALIAGSIATRPAADTDQVMVLFAPGVSAGAAFNALAQADARIIWVDRSGGLWAVKLPDRLAAWQLYRSGAVLVSNSSVAFGCFSWARAGLP